VVDLHIPRTLVVRVPVAVGRCFENLHDLICGRRRPVRFSVDRINRLAKTHAKDSPRMTGDGSLGRRADNPSAFCKVRDVREEVDQRTWQVVINQTEIPSSDVVA
jgi:hypothetical protein